MKEKLEFSRLTDHMNKRRKSQRERAITKERKLNLFDPLVETTENEQTKTSLGEMLQYVS